MVDPASVKDALPSRGAARLPAAMVVATSRPRKLCRPVAHGSSSVISIFVRYTLDCFK